MNNCAMCGRSLYRIIEELKPTDEIECDTGIATKDGIICGCCFDNYIANKLRIAHLKRMELI